MLKKQGFAVWKERDFESFKQHQIRASLKHKEKRDGIYNPIREIIGKYYPNKSKEFILEECRKIIPNINWNSIKSFAFKMRVNRTNYYHKSREKDFTISKPSKEFAWFLGVLAGDGCVTQNKAQLSSTDKEFVNKFNEIGKKLFQLNPHFYIRNYKQYRAGIRYEGIFNSKKLMEYLGDWKEKVWHITLKEKFNWVLRDKDFIISFLEGFFDSEGSVKYNSSKGEYSIKFAIEINKEGRELIINMLNKFGIVGKEYLCYNKKRKESLYRDITITNQKNIVKFVKLIYSCIPKKEEDLQKFRKLNPFIRVCLNCKKEFGPINPKQFCCSQKCMEANYRNKNREKLRKYQREWARNKRMNL